MPLDGHGRTADLVYGNVNPAEGTAANSTEALALVKEAVPAFARQRGWFRERYIALACSRHRQYCEASPGGFPCTKLDPSETPAKRLGYHIW